MCVSGVGDTELSTRTARDAILVHDGGPAWAHNGRTTGEDGQAGTLAESDDQAARRS